METMEECNFNETGQDIFQEDELMSKKRNQIQNTPRAANTTQLSVESPKGEEPIERSKYVYEQINGWIENADNNVNFQIF